MITSSLLQQHILTLWTSNTLSKAKILVVLLQAFYKLYISKSRFSVNAAQGDAPPPSGTSVQTWRRPVARPGPRKTRVKPTWVRPNPGLATWKDLSSGPASSQTRGRSSSTTPGGLIIPEELKEQPDVWGAPLSVLRHQHRGPRGGLSGQPFITWHRLRDSGWSSGQDIHLTYLDLISAQ